MLFNLHYNNQIYIILVLIYPMSTILLVSDLFADFCKDNNAFCSTINQVKNESIPITHINYISLHINSNNTHENITNARITTTDMSSRRLPLKIVRFNNSTPLRHRRHKPSFFVDTHLSILINHYYTLFNTIA